MRIISRAQNNRVLAVFLKARPRNDVVIRVFFFLSFIFSLFLPSSFLLLIRGHVHTMMTVLHVYFIAARAFTHLLTPFIVGTLSLLKRLRAGTLSKYTRIRRHKCKRYRYALVLPPFARSSLTLSRRGTVHLPVLYRRTRVSRSPRCFFSQRSGARKDGYNAG